VGIIEAEEIYAFALALTENASAEITGGVLKASGGQGYAMSLQSASNTAILTGGELISSKIGAVLNSGQLTVEAGATLKGEYAVGAAGGSTLTLNGPARFESSGEWRVHSCGHRQHHPPCQKLLHLRHRLHRRRCGTGGAAA